MVKYGEFLVSLAACGLLLSGVAPAAMAGTDGPILDQSLSNDGKVIFNAGGDESFNASAVHDGLIYTVGYSDSREGTRGFVARYGSLGSLDKDFNRDGIFWVPGQDVSVSDLVVQANGRAVVSGVKNQTVFVLRLGGRGNPDTTFSDDGIKFLPLNSEAEDPTIVLDPNGDLIVATSRYSKETPYLHTAVLWRMNANGTVDSTFSDDGSAVLNLSDREMVASISVDSLHRVVIACSQMRGTVWVGPPLLARLGQDGRFDDSFSENGWLELTTPAAEYGRVLAATPVGLDTVYASLKVSVSDTPSLAVAALTGGGEPDLSFGVDGWAIVPVSPYTHDTDWFINAASITDKGFVFAGSYCGWGNYMCSEGLYLARLTPEGALDATFGKAGVYTGSLGIQGIMDFWNISTDARGRLLVTGTRGSMTRSGDWRYDAVLARLTSPGS